MNIHIFLFLFPTKDFIFETSINVKMRQFGTKTSSSAHADCTIEVQNKELGCVLFDGNEL